MHRPMSPNGSPTLQGEPGAGKTKIGARLARAAEATGETVLCCTLSNLLRDETHRRYKAEGVRDADEVCFTFSSGLWATLGRELAWENVDAIVELICTAPFCKVVRERMRRATIIIFEEASTTLPHFADIVFAIVSGVCNYKGTAPAAGKQIVLISDPRQLGGIQVRMVPPCMLRTAPTLSVASARLHCHECTGCPDGSSLSRPPMGCMLRMAPTALSVRQVEDGLLEGTMDVSEPNGMEPKEVLSIEAQVCQPFYPGFKAVVLPSFWTARAVAAPASAVPCTIILWCSVREKCAPSPHMPARVQRLCGCLQRVASMFICPVAGLLCSGTSRGGLPSASRTCSRAQGRWCAPSSCRASTSRRRRRRRIFWRTSICATTPTG